ncbi:MAG TPA: SpoIIE family protein phosphatase [Candidatus Acidoferrales bacterium]|nr:SpoIIE family protein phosphatase [Candidatus Acidoferrales bacterium]
MSNTSSDGEAVLEVIFPDKSTRSAPLNTFPFYIGRGAEGNHLQLNDARISRQCASIDLVDGQYRLENRGHRRGLFVNKNKVENCILENRDVITFGLDESYEITFRVSTAETSIQTILSRMEGVATEETVSGGLSKLNLLLAATSLLHSQLPLDSVLGTMLDHAVSVTNADRGLLIEAESSATFRIRLARQAGGQDLPTENLAPSQTALRQAIELQSSVITEDLAQADTELQAAMSIVSQHLRAIVVIPLYAMHRSSSSETPAPGRRTDFLGMLYLDSRRPTAFSKIDREILDVLAVQAASILDNARLVERERERQRMEQELDIARNIQQALLPRGFRDFPQMEISGVNYPCHAVGGDYFDVFPLGQERTAFVVADVAGKGLGAALVTTMLQGSFTGIGIGADPVLLFQHMNKFLCEHTEVGRYATVFFGILDRAGNLEYLNAGHPSPVVIHRDRVAELFEGGSFPVGLIPEATFATARAKLEPGDTLVLFSDGVTEAADPEEKMYGVPRLCETLAGEQDHSLEQIQKKVVNSVETFARGASQADDITLLLVRYLAAGQSAAS